MSYFYELSYNYFIPILFWVKRILSETSSMIIHYLRGAIKMGRLGAEKLKISILFTFENRFPFCDKRFLRFVSYYQTSTYELHASCYFTMKNAARWPWVMERREKISETKKTIACNRSWGCGRNGIVPAKWKRTTKSVPSIEYCKRWKVVSLKERLVLRRRNKSSLIHPEKNGHWSRCSTCNNIFRMAVLRDGEVKKIAMQKTGIL